jgi:hypothetical protein
MVVLVTKYLRVCKKQSVKGSACEGQRKKQTEEKQGRVVKEEQCFCILVNLFLHCKPLLCVCLSCGIVKMKILMKKKKKSVKEEEEQWVAVGRNTVLLLLSCFFFLFFFFLFSFLF